MLDVASVSCTKPETPQFSGLTVLHPHAAYRRGLCTDCQQVAPAAGMPRCYPCHAGFTGARLTPELARQSRIRVLAGPVPNLPVMAAATFLVELLDVIGDR